MLAVSLCGPAHTNGDLARDGVAQGSPVPEAKDKDVEETSCSQDAAGNQHDIGDVAFHDAQSLGIARGRGASSPAMTGSASKRIKSAWS